MDEYAILWDDGVPVEAEFVPNSDDVPSKEELALTTLDELRDDDVMSLCDEVRNIELAVENHKNVTVSRKDHWWHFCNSWTNYHLLLGGFTKWHRSCVALRWSWTVGCGLVLRLL